MHHGLKDRSLQEVDRLVFVVFCKLVRFVFVVCWKLACVDFCYVLEACWVVVVLGVFWRSILGVLGACKAHFWGLGGFAWLLGVQETSKRPPWKHFGAFWFWEALGSHLGIVLVLCCNFLEIFLGCQIHLHLEGVSEAILGDFATS